MNNIDNNMEKLFNLNPISVAETPVQPPSIVPTITDLDIDLDDTYHNTKTNLESLVTQGADALDEILSISKASQNPRAFEVYANLLKTVIDANKELMNHQKEIRNISGVGVKRESTNKTSIEKAIFIGSTDELSKFLKNESINGN